LSFHSVDETCVVLAGVSCPNDRRIGWCSPKTSRKRVGVNIVRLCRGAATAARERLTAFEEEFLCEQFIVRTGSINFVGHKTTKFIRKPSAGLAYRRIKGVRIKICVETIWECLA
jgi:hypothetical protein